MSSTGGPTGPFDAFQEMPSFGPEWDAARSMGVDTAMLLENLSKTPAERIAALVAHNRFVWLVHNSVDAPDLPPKDR